MFVASASFRMSASMLIECKVSSANLLLKVPAGCNGTVFPSHCITLSAVLTQMPVSVIMSIPMTNVIEGVTLNVQRNNQLFCDETERGERLMPSNGVCRHQQGQRDDGKSTDTKVSG